MRESSTAVVLENATLRVELFPDRPAARSYLHKPTGERLGGAGAEALLRLNGVNRPWPEWRVWVRTDPSGLRATYELRLEPHELIMHWELSLAEDGLSVSLLQVTDRQAWLQRLEWVDWPLLRCLDPEYRWWRERGRQHPWSEPFGGLWSLPLEEGALAGRTDDGQPEPAVHLCLYKPSSLCAFVHSNYPLLPLLSRVESGSFGVSLNAYRYRIGGRTTPLLRAQVVFLPDINGDGRADPNDYLVWMRRHLPELPDPRYRTALWYKIFLGSLWDRPTTFAQAEEIVAAIHHATDGLPQIVYLVGWQGQGHDTDYPSFDTVNPHAGHREDLLRLVRVAASRYQARISYHLNVDEAYRESRDWDESALARGPDGDPRVWGEYRDRVAYHLSHARQVADGSLFRRLEAMFQTVPVQDTLHLDAFRNINCNPAWEPDGIGLEEETLAGLIPILRYLAARGVSVTTEGTNGMPLELAGLFSGLWHFDYPLEYLPMYHGTLLLGGRRDESNLADGIGRSFNNDLTYEPTDLEGFYSLKRDWGRILDRIYLGGLLYHFYLEHELLGLERRADGAIRLWFASGLEVLAGPGDRLRATWGEVAVAVDLDRFIPRGQAVYAYSRDGSEREWVLPQWLRDRPLEVFSLGPDGRGPAPPHRILGRSVRLALPPRSPVKLACR